MNHQPEHWIAAYLDGELTPHQARQVESHLAECPACQKVLEEQQSLSTLLQTIPTATGLKPQDRFVAEVGLRLVRRGKPTVQPAQLLQWGWQAFPLALLAGGAFIQTVVILSWLTCLPAVEQALHQLSFQLDIPATVGLSISWLPLPGLLNWNTWSSLLALVILGILYTGWISGWVIQQYVQIKTNHQIR